MAQAQAQVRQAQAQVQQAQAALRLAEVNSSHTTITSPIDGVVVSRNVDVGQTVAASLSAPTLFTIANDLTRMQVIASIDQADIGVINESNRVNFTVDAFPGENFQGTIQQIRLNPQKLKWSSSARTCRAPRSRKPIKERPGVSLLVGGLIGILLGLAVSLLIPWMLGWPTLVSVAAILGSVLFSAAVGICFGYFPARKAAGLDPIEALRHE